MQVAHTTADDRGAARDYLWSGLKPGDFVVPVSESAAATLTLQMEGEGTVAIVGSNSPEGNDMAWHVLHDPFGAPLTLSVPGLYLVAERPRWLRPHPLIGETIIRLEAARAKWAR